MLVKFCGIASTTMHLPIIIVDPNNRFVSGWKLSESKGFSTIISHLFTDCDVFEPDPRLREDYEISEIELKNCVKKALSKIKYRYPNN